MGVEENVSLATAFEEAYNARDWDAVRNTLAESVVIYDPAEPEPLRGPVAVLGMLQGSAAFFPTSRIESVHALSQGDRVCVENVETGARKDSEAAYRIRTCYTFKVAGNVLSEIRFYYDALDMMNQIGMALGED
ncbi:MAG: nuclear transport factor 2 family protein [Thermoplasmata archaeon]